MYESRDNSHVLCECPNCGRRALAQISNERYECLWCDFYRDLSHRHGLIRTGRGNGGAFFFILIAVIIGLLISGG